MINDDVRSRVAQRVASAKAPLPASALGRRAHLIAGLATASAKSVGRSVRRRFGGDGGDVEPEVALATSLGRLKGPVMKVGQMLGYIDVGLPDGLRAALAALQTKGPALDADRVRSLLDEDLGDPGRHLARAMRSEPLSSASVGQVHRSKLPDGTAVAVKVLHPEIARIIAGDVAPTMLVSRIHSPVHTIVADVRHRFLEECDYRLEARRQTRFASIFADHETIVIPAVYPDYSSARVLTTAFVDGVHLDEFLASEPSRAARDRAGEALFDFYAGSLFKHGLYNCDPHPGNYLFLPDGRVAIVDFGCARELAPGFVERLAALTRALIADDRDRIRAALSDLGLDDGASSDRDALTWLLRAFYRPLANDDAVPLALGADVTVGQVLKHAWKARRFAGMAELFFLMRTFLGLASVLGRLDVRAPWGRRLAQVVAKAAAPVIATPPPPSTKRTGPPPLPASRPAPPPVAAAPVTPPPLPPPVKVDPDAWDVVLVSAGASPIALIRALRELLAMELRKLEELVDTVPQALRSGVTRADAEALRTRLEEIGAQIEVRRTPIASDEG
jgi:predicted unusual protein kinase regulating ubiquinone biosynthesis (AarF/ABC1/UbiB family)/ribosomal protein L7/L12